MTSRPGRMKSRYGMPSIYCVVAEDEDATGWRAYEPRD
jgi:hypothetical protein